MSDERIEVIANALGEWLQPCQWLRDVDGEVLKPAGPAPHILAALEAAGYSVAKLEQVGCIDFGGPDDGEPVLCDSDRFAGAVGSCAAGEPLYRKVPSE